RIAGGIKRAVEMARAKFGNQDSGFRIQDSGVGARFIVPKTVQGSQFRIEVEAKTLTEVEEALDAGADIILLDNMDVAQLKEAVALIGNRAQIEVSGGVNLENVRQIANLGVHYISVGALTHSAPAIDISMKIINGQD
ncbi:MAG: hypothetical protein AB1546_00600, partial [bacterium]